MSDKNSSSVNFSKPINYVKTNFAKLGTTMFYFPLLVSYSNFSEKIEEASSLAEKEGNDSEIVISKFAEAIELFNYKEVKTFINDSVLEISSLLNATDEDTDFFKQNYPNLHPITKKYELSESATQQLRNQLFSFFRILNNELAEMERAYRKMESIFEKSNDNSSNLRNGWTGGLIGAGIGSVLLPGIGTAIGAAAGGYLMNRDKNKKTVENFYHELTIYSEHADRIVNALGNNAKELYKILEKFVDKYYKNNARGIYLELQKENHNADKIFTEFFNHEIQEVNNLLTAKLDDEDPESGTYNDIIIEVQEFLNEYKSVE